VRMNSAGAARRHLTSRAFAAVNDVYRDAAARTHRWIKTQCGEIRSTGSRPTSTGTPTC